MAVDEPGTVWNTRIACSRTVSEICSTQPTVMSPDDKIEEAVKVMREKAIRRILVVDEHDQTIGVVSLGDLALERDGWSAPAQISAAPPNQ